MKYILIPLALTIYLVIEKSAKLFYAALVFIWYFSLDKKHYCFLRPVHTIAPIFEDYTKFLDLRDYYGYFMTDDKDRYIETRIIKEFP